MPFLSFSTASDPRNNFISVPEAISAVSYMLLQFLGPILLIGAIFGAVQLLRSGKDKLSELNPERLFYLSWTALLLVTAVALAANYGANMQARFLLLLMVLLMPIGGYALTKLPYFAAKIASGKKASFMVALVLASLFSIESSLITCWLIKPDIFITTMKTAELDALSDWLKKTHNDDKTIVFTSINYRAFQVPLQCPKLVGRSNIVMDFWTPLLDLRDELKAQPPNFLVTGDDDGKDLAALTSVADFSIAKPAIFENGFVHAYKIIPGTFACKPDPKMPACFWYPTPNWRTLFQSWKRKTTQNHSTSS